MLKLLLIFIAEQQISKLKKENGDLNWKSKIRKEFDSYNLENEYNKRR